MTIGAAIVVLGGLYGAVQWVVSSKVMPLDREVRRELNELRTKLQDMQREAEANLDADCAESAITKEELADQVQDLLDRAFGVDSPR